MWKTPRFIGFKPKRSLSNHFDKLRFFLVFRLYDPFRTPVWSVRFFSPFGFRIPGRHDFRLTGLSNFRFANHIRHSHDFHSLLLSVVCPSRFVFNDLVFSKKNSLCIKQREKPVGSLFFFLVFFLILISAEPRGFRRFGRFPGPGVVPARPLPLPLISLVIWWKHRI